VTARRHSTGCSRWTPINWLISPLPTQQAIGGLISLLSSVVQLMEEIGPLPVIGDAHTTVFDHSTRRPTP